MKTKCKIESFYYSDKTNFSKCDTTKGCYRDKWSHNESERFTYYLVNIEDSIKYITFKGIKYEYMDRRGNMFISKIGVFPASMNKKNTLVKKIN